MAPPGELNLLKDPQLKDKDKETYNGYITTSVASVDRPQFTSWTLLNGKVKIGPVESGSGFIILCLLWLVFASVPEGVLHGVCTVVQRIFTIFLPLVCLVCVFYWAELLIHKYCKSQISYVVFPVCLLGELCTQVILGGSDFLRTTFLFTLVMAGLVTVVFSKLKILPTSIALLLLTTARMSCWITLRDIPSFLRPFLAYFSAFSGLILSRNIQACFSATAGEAIQSKAPIIRRRTSSVSSTSSLNSRRRPSLPALGTQPKGSVDCTTLGEAHGMISDLLADSNLPPNVASTLKIISTMIAPPTAFHVGQRPFVSPMTPLIEKFRDEHQEDKVKDQPDLKDDLPLPMVGQLQRMRRNLNTTGRRMSSTWTTTTSATGMPTLDPDVTVGRTTPVLTFSEHNANTNTSKSLPKPSPLAEGAVTNTKNGPQETYAKHRPACFSHSFPAQGSPGLTRKLSPEMAPSGSPLIPRRSPERGTSSPSSSSPNLMRKSPDRMFASSNVFRRLSREETQLVKDALDQAEQQPEEIKSCSENESSSKPCSCDCHSNSSSREEGNKTDQTKKASEKEPDLTKETPVLPKSKELDKLLDQITDWNFPIFDVCDHGNVLTQVTYKVFQKVGLFEAFKIPRAKFLNFFFALESGYHDIPYHNSIHASDVLHGVFFMTTKKIPGFCPKLNSDSGSDSDSGLNGEGRQKTSSGDYGSLKDSIPLLELLSLYTAATMHDYDHPGRTNAFLVATLSQQALLYNDRSVLENHHAAAAFSLLMSDPKYNFLCELEPVEFKRFRFLAIEAVLATDLKRHFDLLSEFNAKISEGGGIDWSQEADRLLTLQICIKMADISGPSKRRDLHTRWTERIVEEFYEQGDDELAHDMPISPYMDRDQPHVAQLQESFINHLVAPLYNAYANAGLLPGEWVETEASSSDLESDDEDSCEEGARNPEGERRKPKKSRRRKQRKITSDLTTNIENNYKMWLEVIKQEEREKRKVNKAESEDRVDNDIEGSDEELMMIETSLKDEIIEEEENGSESGSNPAESRKQSNV